MVTKNLLRVPYALSYADFNRKLDQLVRDTSGKLNLVHSSSPYSAFFLLDRFAAAGLGTTFVASPCFVCLSLASDLGEHFGRQERICQLNSDSQCQRS